MDGRRVQIGNTIYSRAADGYLTPIATIPAPTPKAKTPDGKTGMLDYYLGGTGIPERLRAVNNIFNPVEAVGQSMAASQDMFAPNATGWERVQAAGDMLSGVASVLPLGKIVGASDDLARGALRVEGAVQDFATDEFGGVTLYHGSPKAGLRELLPSPEGTGALGPGVYGSPFRRTAEMYTRDGGDVYQFEAPDDMFLGAGNRWDDIPSNVSSYQVWRDQVARLAEANPDQAEIIRAAGEKMLYDGYSFFRELAYRLGSKEAAQELYKRAGFKGLTAMVDGPEAVLFDAVNLAPSNPNTLGFGDEVASRGAQIMDMLRSGRGADVTDEMLDMGDPTLNARLNEWLFNNYDLPMDAASRAARAREMGFDGDLYHGTGADFPAFYDARRGNFFTDKPEIADIYASGSTGGSASIRGQASNAGANYIPVKLRGPDLTVTDKGPDGSHGWLTDNIAASVPGVEKFPLGTYPRRLNDAARSQGYGAIRIDDMLDLGGEQTQWMSIDPSGIRSRFARFDPRLSHLRNLSAGGLLPFAAFFGPDQEQQ